MEFFHKPAPAELSSLQALPAVDAGSFSVIAGKHVCIFRMHGCKSTGPMLMKLTTIHDVSHVISYTRPSSPSFFSGGIERKAWDRG